MSVDFGQDDYNSDSDDDYVPAEPSNIGQKRECSDSEENDTGDDNDDDDVIAAGSKERDDVIADDCDPEKRPPDRIDDLWAAFKSDTNTPLIAEIPPRQLHADPTLPSRSETMFVSNGTKKELDSLEACTNKDPMASTAPTDTLPIVKPVESDQVDLRVEGQCEAVVSEGDKVEPLKKPFSGVLSKRRPVAGGLKGLVDNMSKKPKLSTLDKSESDWSSFKHQEGIEEELTSHNRGKEGFVERQQFLQRADVRQFEREREIRRNKRK